MTRLALLLALLVCCAFPLSAQEGALRAGAKVRITGSGGERVTGRVVSLGADSLGVRLSEGGQVVPLQGETVEVSRGRRRVLWTTVGVVAGATAGVLVTRAQEDDPEDVTGLGRVADGVGNTLTGAVAGGLLGFFLAPERWRQVTVPARVTLRRGGAEVGLSFSF